MSYPKSSAHPGVTFYVAPDGDDRWSGRRRRPTADRTDGPLATLEAARDAIRTLRGSGSTPDGDIVVLIAPGLYSREKTFELTAEDSGTADSPVIYRAASLGKARVVGGRIISEFRPVKDIQVLNRISPEARRHVRVADLKALGITDFGTLKSRGFGRATVPAALELFFDGQPMTLARWPNVDFTTISDIPPESNQNDGWGGAIATPEAGFMYRGDRLKRWHSLDDVWIHGYWTWDWANTYERIASYDARTGLIRTAPPHAVYGFRPGQRFFFQNVLEELDQPGEWYLDRNSGLLYFWPPKPLRGHEVAVSLLEEPLVRLRDVSHVTIEGLALEYVRGNAVEVCGGQRVLLAGCTIRNVGNWAVIIEGDSEHRVISCDISFTGDGGVHLKGGDRKTLTPCNHIVENCHIHNFSRWSKCYCPAILASGVGMRFAHNRMHNAPHTAILFSGNEFIIEYNEIYHVCMETGDAGAIYTGRDYTFRGNVVQYNFIHHMGGVGMGTMGIYNDDCVSGTKMIGNVFYRATRAVMCGGGRDFLIQNNLFVDCHPAISFDARGISKHPVWVNMVKNTLLQRLQEMNYLQPPYSTRYPELMGIKKYYDADEGVPPENCLAVNNICIRGQWLAGELNYADSFLETRNNLITDDDPGLANLMRLDFRLTRPSVLKKFGFKPIPVAKIGPQRDLWQRTIPMRQLVHASLKVIRDPVRRSPATAASATLRLTIENLGQTTASGAFGLQVNPEEAASIRRGGRIAYSIKPGQRLERDITVALATGHDAATVGLFHLGEDFLRQRLTVATKTAAVTNAQK